MTWFCVPYVMTQLASAGSQPVSNVFFRHQGALTPDIRWLGLSLAPPNVIHGITTLPSSILSTHPMGDCSHGLSRSSQSVGKFPIFSVYTMTLSLILIQQTHHSLASLQKHNIYTGHLFTWVSWYTLRLYKMEPSWRTVPPTLANMGYSRSHGWILAFRSWLWT